MTDFIGTQTPYDQAENCLGLGVFYIL
jgi:hypothetical protein